MSSNVIRVVGARQHNLKNITVEIPRDKLVVITGLSGSGKSSLAFDTIFAEGQRRYVESLSAYARQFIGQMDKPDVDYIDGLSPAVSIDQKSTSHNPRSTVGTVTEIYDYLRLLYARIGIPHCPVCGREVVKQSAQEIVEAIEKLPEGERILILAPVVRGRKGTYQAVFEEIRKAGFVRSRVDGKVLSLDDEIELDRYKQHTIEAVVDRIVISHPADEDERTSARTRLTDSVETALKFGEGFVTVGILESREQRAESSQGNETNNSSPISNPLISDLHFSEHLSCPEHGISLGEIEPRTFSFNTPQGACPECQGLGSKLEIDPGRVIDPERSLNDGAMIAMEWNNVREDGNSGYYWQMLEAMSKHYRIDMNKPFKELSAEQQEMILRGTKGERIRVNYRNREGRTASFDAAFEGIIGNLERRYRDTNSEYIRSKISEYMSDRPCPSCQGKRLRAEALAVTVADVNILQITEWPVNKSLEWAQKLNQDEVLTPRQKAISERILKEISSRLGFLVNVGLDYLTLNRSAATLSGGEAQRIRLATQVGSRLVGVLYVLDEPSIGLHPRDNDRLLETLRGLRDLGNTVLIVEHDDETIRTADWIIDLGPAAGEHGGEVVAEGLPAAILANENSLTGQYLSGKKQVEIPEKRRNGSGKSLKIVGATANNLKGVSVDIPLGRLVCITGVSGSGKSTLMTDVLHAALAAKLMGAHTHPGAHERIEGIENLDKIINIDQSPIGRTSRSNPGTYTGLWDEVRKLFAELPESKIRGYKPGRFSFNVHGGRCEACQGQGELRIEMQFLPDIYVPCDVCHGKRFNRETLQVAFKGYNISDVLNMTVDHALETFSAFPQMVNKLTLLQEVGLGYVRVGQSANTLSGGEAQRVKLSKELSRRATGRTLYVLDEPSVGLHAADVHKLIEVLQRLVGTGNSVLIIEHNLDIVKVADWVIDLGPEGGDAGGQIIAEGTPEDVMKVKGSYTGQFLKAHLENAAEANKP
jgi:excinuclease ABC subunit A